MPKGDVYEKTGPSTWTLRANIAGPPAGGLALVTSLPASPVDGQECYFLADATNGVVWHLRYRAAGTTYKWEFLGGPALQHQLPDLGAAPTNVWGDLNAGPVGPQLVAPLAGLYDLFCGVAYVQVTNAASWCYIGPSINGATPTDPPSISVTPYSAGNTIWPALIEWRITLAAAATVVMKYNQTGGGGNVKNRWLRLQPVKVG